MTQEHDYKTLADGSIDYAHYDRVCRQIRSRDAFAACRLVTTTFKGTVRLALGVLTALHRPHSPRKQLPRRLGTQPAY